MVITPANKITFGRILAVPVFILLLLYYNNSYKFGTAEEIYRFLAIGLFIVIILCDVLDGYIARKRNEVTKLGTIIDPVADKALLISSFIILSGTPPSRAFASLPLWFVVLVISRDIIQVSGAILIHHLKGTVMVQSKYPGKIATFFQALLIMLILFKVKETPFEICLFTAASFTILSAIQYCIDGYRQMEIIQPTS